MKRIILYSIFVLLVLAGCSQADRDNRQAAIYAEKLERGEAVSADEYSKIVEFYCAALDRSLAEIEPAARLHVTAIENNDSAAISTTAANLNEAISQAYAKRKDLVRLGSGLEANMTNIPDSTRTHLMNHILKVTLKYSDFH